MSASSQRKLQQANDKLQRGDIAAAAALCEEVLARAPRNPEALWLLGTARLMNSKPEDAAPLFERAVEAAPANGAVLESLGLARLMLAQYAEAERVLRRAAAIAGAPASVRMRLGLALLHQGQHAAAVTELERVAALEPRNADAHLMLGQAYAGAESWAAAAQAFERVLTLQADHVDALYNLGVASTQQRALERARACFERILQVQPSSLDARERLAALHLRVGRYGEAIDQLREILRTRPDDADVLVALADASFQTGALEEAEKTARQATALDASASGPYSTLAQIHYVRGELDQAAAVLELGYERTGARPLLGLQVHLLHRLCEWDRWREAWQRMSPLLDVASDLGSPFSLLSEETTAQQQLSYTTRWAAARFGATPPAAKRASRAHRRLRIGYFSSEFHEHAAAYLLAQVLELHDRARFEVFAYSYGPDDRSAMRARVTAAVEHFVDVAWQPDDLVIERMRADHLDVLVDLKGYTAGDRLTVMAQRPCPVQVTWLGYPGTTGADFIDYLIADEYIVPAGAEALYSENVLRMPHCYQANDRKRPIVEPLTRAQYGLPDDAFVFCCFNQAVKYTPQVFARWMRLLQNVSGSVLWLPHDNDSASANLKREAKLQGVAGERIVFGARLPFAQHLARFRVADLALDTFPYTSHTTASDGLWMGCPLVALCGDTFAARVSGSVLSSCGLADLVTHSFDDYETLAQRLATDSALMQDIRARLAVAREQAPLFDTSRFTRDLEQLYERIAN
jgi:predicted O-linked N-acetylglucosamine transferase (SPINDLY family)